MVVLFYPSSEINHLDGCHSTFVAFVSQLSSAAVFCLLHVVGSNQTVDNGNVLSGIKPGESRGSTLTDVIEVRSVTSNHTTDGNYGIEWQLRHLLCTIDEFETARHGHDFYVVFAYTVVGKRLECPIRYSIH